MKMDKVVSATEHYDAKAGAVRYTAVDPFDGKVVYMEDGIMYGTDEHFVSQEHGCGGTVFVFREVEKPKAVAVEALAPGAEAGVCDATLAGILRQLGF